MSGETRSDLEQQLINLGRSHPDSAVYAVDRRGAAFVDLPVAIQNEFAWVLSADSPVELMAVPFRQNGIDIFTACQKSSTSTAMGPVRLADEPDRTVELHLFDLGDLIVGAIIDPNNRIALPADDADTGVANTAPAAAAGTAAAAAVVDVDEDADLVELDETADAGVVIEEAIEEDAGVLPEPARTVLAPPPARPERPATLPTADASTIDQEDAADPIDASAIYGEADEADAMQAYLDSDPVITVPPVVRADGPDAETAIEHGAIEGSHIEDRDIEDVGIKEGAADANVPEMPTAHIPPMDVPDVEVDAPVEVDLRDEAVPVDFAAEAPTAAVSAVVGGAAPAAVLDDPEPAAEDELHLDSRRRILDAGPLVEQQLGWSHRDLVGRTITDFMHPDDIEDGLQSWFQMVGTAGATRVIRNRYWHRDGAWRWFDQTDMNLLSDPSTQAIVTQFVDVTEEMAGYVPGAVPAEPMPLDGPLEGGGGAPAAIAEPVAASAPAAVATAAPAAVAPAPVAPVAPPAPAAPTRTKTAGAEARARWAQTYEAMRPAGSALLHATATGRTVHADNEWYEVTGMTAGASLQDFRNTVAERTEFDAAVARTLGDKTISDLEVSARNRQVSLRFLPQNMDDGRASVVALARRRTPDSATPSAAVPAMVAATGVAAAVAAPNVAAPTANLPDVDLPDVDLPEVDLPAVNTPAMAAPAVPTAPAIHAPDMPDVPAPAMAAPVVPSAPAVETPDITSPNLPQMDVPTVRTAPAHQPLRVDMPDAPARRVAAPVVPAAPPAPQPTVPAPQPTVPEPTVPPQSVAAPQPGFEPAVVPEVDDPKTRQVEGRRSRPFTWRHLLGLLAILAVAAGLRGWDLTALPSGLSGTEAVAGLEGDRILNDGLIGIYSTEDHGRPSLPYYATAAGVAALGNTTLAVRIVSVIAGLITIAALYFIARKYYGSRIAFGAAAALALMTLHIHFSRIGFTDIWWPLIGLVGASAVAMAMHKRSVPRSLLAGVLVGAGVYVSDGHWIYLIAMLIAGLLWMLTGKERITAFLAMAFAAIATAAPMGLWLRENTAEGIFRIGDDAAWSDASLLGKAELAGRWYLESWDTLLFDPAEDLTNGTGLVSSIPFLLLIGAVIGLALIIVNFRSPFSWVVLTLLALLPFGQAFANDAEVDRMFVLTPLLALLFGVAWGRLYEVLRDRVGSWLAWAVGGVALAAVAFFSINTYFGSFNDSTGQAWQFNTALTKAADVVEDLPGEPYINLISDRYDYDYVVPAFLLDDHDGRDLDNGYELAEVDDDQVFLITGNEVATHIEALGTRYPSGEIVEIHTDSAQPYAVFRVAVG